MHKQGISLLKSRIFQNLTSQIPYLDKLEGKTILFFEYVIRKSK